jgi:hypothetical protein
MLESIRLKDCTVDKRASERTIRYDAVVGDTLLIRRKAGSALEEVKIVAIHSLHDVEVRDAFDVTAPTTHVRPAVIDTLVLGG